MGDLNVKLIKSQNEQNAFTRNLLDDLHILEQMLQEDWFEKGQMHIGAEQEICLLDEHYKPACIADEVLKKIQSDNYTTELAKFNVEVNLSPQPFTNSCLSDMGAELAHELQLLDKALEDTRLSYLTTGILPTLRKSDLSDDHITPLPRYYALMDAIRKMRGQDQEIHIKGYDELNVKHDSAMLEACNTSFQVHLQVTPEDFAAKYNLAQLIAAPTLALSANSPMLFGKRLWHETRIALFEQSIDTRITSDHLREQSPRVTFGNEWVSDSLLEIFKEDIVRFRPMLMTEREGDYHQMLKEGITPQLRALSIHNSTVYRWNRPCFGISPNGKPHLRIENRILPAGPTQLDEMANVAFWVGTMNAIGDHYPQVDQKMDFKEVKSNFYNCAQTGLNTKVRWFGKDKISVSKVIKEELIPIAREGLIKNKLNEADIDKYLGVISDRVETGQNGAVWALRSFKELATDSSKEEVILAITSSMSKNQQTGKPVHEWKLASLKELLKLHPSSILVEEFMTIDLFTVQKGDIIELVADMMDWKHIRFTPVEDKKGKLIGLVSMRMVTRHLQKNRTETPGSTRVQDLMIKNPITISPESSIFDAMNLMREHHIGCLPVVSNGRLVGIVTEGNFLNITATLLKIINQSGQAYMNERILGDFDSGEKSNLMILVGALHGNEMAGYRAINNVFGELREEKTKINGRVIGIAGNLQAIKAKKRFIDHDMNRAWKPEVLDRVLATPEEDLVNEDKELRMLHSILDELGTQDYQHKYLIDLHTTSADNGIFLVHPGYPAQDSIARELRLPTVVNLDVYLPGTLLKFMKGYGFTLFAFEAGQIGSPKAIDIHTFGIWELLHKSGIIDQSKDLAHLIHYEEILASLQKSLPGTVRVLHRHEITQQDYFHMRPGYKNFQTVRKGELLARDKQGEIHAPMDGLIFMPLYQNAGNDGFFIVEELQ